MIEVLFLLGIGFVVGLSGALLPGPLLAFTVADSMKRGVVSGPLVIVGHAAVEVAIIFLLIFSIGNYIIAIKKYIFLVGGIFLIFMAYQMVRSRGEITSVSASKNSIAGGVLFSVFNPGTPIWWASAGWALLIKGLEALSYAGLLLVVVGHWLADLGYYTFVSYSVDRGRDYLLARNKAVTSTLAAFLFALGGYFIYSFF